MGPQIFELAEPLVITGWPVPFAGRRQARRPRIRPGGAILAGSQNPHAGSSGTVGILQQGDGRPCTPRSANCATILCSFGQCRPADQPGPCAGSSGRSVDRAFPHLDPVETGLVFGKTKPFSNLAAFHAQRFGVQSLDNSISRLHHIRWGVFLPAQASLSRRPCPWQNPAVIRVSDWGVSAFQSASAGKPAPQSKSREARRLDP